jgi:mono/diheme cytochrome c family protein
MGLKTLFAVAAVAALTACAPVPQQSAAAAPGAAPPDRAALIARGRALAETHCTTCHAIGETGESRLPAAPPFRTLAVRYPVNMLQEAFAEGVLVGHPAMPEFRFEPDEIDALVAYLESIQERRGG